MSNPTGFPVPSPDGLRALPEKPNLEFEHKRAKQLLEKIRSGDPEALTHVRARLPKRRRSEDPEKLKLADAQFAVAREYGFANWPRLVSYFETWDRHERTGPMFGSFHTRVQGDMHVRTTLRSYRTQRFYSQLLATFVPRLYGLGHADFQTVTVTEEEARLAVARMYRFSTWEACLSHAESRGGDYSARRAASPLGQALRSMYNFHVDALTAIVGDHPELLASLSPWRNGDSLIRNALLHEVRTRDDRARHITDWLVSRGADLAPVLNTMLIGFHQMTPNDVSYLLERGADPNWMPPNGITILEHALLRYWNPEAVDLIAARVVPRKAFWIAAGLGDARAVRRYVDRNGKLTEAARRHRPDFTAAFLASLPCSPEATDEDVLWEAFFVAGVNQRTEVLDLLLDLGMPIDCAPWRGTLLHFAVGNRMVPVIECLVKRGASLDVKNDDPTPKSARELASEWYEQDPSDPEFRRIFELCGGSP